MLEDDAEAEANERARFSLYGEKPPQIKKKCTENVKKNSYERGIIATWGSQRGYI